MNNEITLLNEIIAQQEKTLFDCGRRIVPHLTAEDILQPYDYPELEHNGHFRYEEGVLAGLMTALTALRALNNGKQHDTE